MNIYMQNMLTFCEKNFPEFKKGKKYKIAFTGTHGTGKTTALNIAHAWIKLTYPVLNTRLMPELARESVMKINEDATFETQMWMLSKHTEQELFLTSKYDVLLCDRTVYDYIAYMFSLFGEKKELLAAYKELMHSYTQIYYIPLDERFPAENDGVRSTDPIWRREVDILIKRNLQNGNFENVIYLKNSPLC